MRKILLPVANVCRVLVGALFVVSGLIKINDALGFMYKLEEYLEPGALNLEAWTPWALELGMLASIGEVLLGVALLVGALPRLTTALTLVLMLFFTWLTWYTDHCDPFGSKTIVENGIEVEIPTNACSAAVASAMPFPHAARELPQGCGPAHSAPAHPAERLDWGIRAQRPQPLPLDVRDGPDDHLGLRRGHARMGLPDPVPGPRVGCGRGRAAAGFGTRRNGPWRPVCWSWPSGSRVYTLQHLPVKDYRPYAVGEDVNRNMASADELGLDPPVYDKEVRFFHPETGADTVIMQSGYMAGKLWEDEAFKARFPEADWANSIEVKVSDGYEPLIFDLDATDADGESRLAEMLSEGYTLWHVSKDLATSEAHGQPEINALFAEAAARGWRVAALTPATMEEAEAYRTEQGPTIRSTPPTLPS